MAHFLVTGGAGYVGSHSLRCLARAGHDAVVLDDLSSGQRFLVGDVPLVQGDVCDPNVVSRVFEERGPFDAVLHFAALISVGKSVKDPERYRRINVGGTETRVEAALTHGTRAFVLSSSAAVYGEPETQPVSETARLAPVNPYGQTKLDAERILENAQRRAGPGRSGLNWAALRYFNASGADPEGGLGECHQPETHLIPCVLEALTGLRSSLEIFGTDWPSPDGTCVRDYIPRHRPRRRPPVGCGSPARGSRDRSPQPGHWQRQLGSRGARRGRACDRPSRSGRRVAATAWRGFQRWKELSR